MNCPKCNVYMDLKNYHGYEVNWCYSCGGIWVEEKKIMEIFAQTSFLSSITKELNQIASSAKNLSDRECAACKESNLIIFKLKNCELDFCPNCMGIYFDSGELSSIAPLANKSLQDVSYYDNLWDQTIDKERLTENNPILSKITNYFMRWL